MSSTGPSLARSRSLRKPTPGSAADLSRKPPSAASTASSSSTATATSTSTPAAAAAVSRGLSPTRLPSLRSSRPPISAPPAQPSLANAAPPTALKKPRPLSGLTRGGAVTARPPAAQDSQQPAAPSRRYPPNASASASAHASAAAIKRPNSSGGLPQPPPGGPAAGGRALGHARAKSTTTAAAAMATTTAAGSTMTTARSRTISSTAPVLRPPSQTSQTSAAPKSRPLSIHGRPPSASDRHAPSKPTSQPSRVVSSSKQQPPPQPPPAAGTALAADAPRLRTKPAFSTHQQHFSPLRRPGPKTLTAAYLAPPSPSKLPSNVASSAETARLQTDLLQLHLLHREAAPARAAWDASARETLADRHAALGAASSALAAREARAAEAADVAALLAWGHALGGLDAALNALDPLLTGLWALHAPAGRCARLARHFSRWCDRFTDAEAARARLASSPAAAPFLVDDEDDESSLLAGPIDAEWKEQAAHLTRRLETWARQLRDLRCRHDARPESTICRALDGCAALVADTLAEIAVMEDIERLAVARERDWIRRMNREDDGSPVSSLRHDAPRAGAVWRTF